MKKGILRFMSLLLLLVTFLNSSCTKEESSDPTIVSIAINKAPNIISYIEGAILDLSGIELSLIYSDDSKISIVCDDFISSGITCSIPQGVKLSIEVKTLVFTHIESGMKVSINISVAERILSEFSIKTPMLNTEYTVGEHLDFYGLVLNLLMNDGTSIDVAYSSFSSYGIDCSMSEDDALTEYDELVSFVHSKSHKSLEQYITVKPVITNQPIFGSMTDARDGITYKTVTLGEQTWMAENLRHIGSIPFKATKKEWSIIDYTEAACAYANFDKGYSEQNSYGVMYSWEAVKDAAPEGWHVASEDDWDQLETFLVENDYQYKSGAYKMDVAKSMASKDGWQESTKIGNVGNSPSTNNRSGFNAKACGQISHYGGEPICGGIYAWWWTSSTHRDAGAEGRRMHAKASNLFHMGYDRFNGFAIRCVRD